MGILWRWRGLEGKSCALYGLCGHGWWTGWRHIGYGIEICLEGGQWDNTMVWRRELGLECVDNAKVCREKDSGHNVG